MIRIYKCSASISTLILISGLASQFFGEAEAHVSLTFPPARKYNLDYLDSYGSPPPCGMPQDNRYTSLVSGSTINVTWHLGYPHRGSYRLELLSSNGTELYTLVSEEDTSDTTAQRHEVTLPEGFVCDDCIIRLKRQSGELGNPEYWFWSCGDVEIVEPEKYVETCFGRGRARQDGKCGCRAGFWGRHCQYEDECRKDNDCGKGNGRCIDLGGTTLPRRQCFCSPGYHGKKCYKASSLGDVPLPNPDTLTDEFLIKNYLHQVLDKTNRIHLFWRLIEGDTLQIEFLLHVNGTSYVALGWRPSIFEGDCVRYPASASDNSIVSSPRKTRQTKNRPHAMSCTDVVIGAARGNYSRVLDYWSGDISTPREDALYGGTDDIKAATAWEADGFTTLVFRKNVFAKDVRDRFNDWALDLPSIVIWARGQEHGEYVHSLPSGVDEGQPASVPNYYTMDEVKYHGYGTQRGAFTINFLAPGTREFFQNWSQKAAADE